MGFANNLLPVKYLADYLQEQERKKGNEMEHTKTVDVVPSNTPPQPIPHDDDDVVLKTLDELKAKEPINQSKEDIDPTEDCVPKLDKLKL